MISDTGTMRSTATSGRPYSSQDDGVRERRVRITNTGLTLACRGAGPMSRLGVYEPMAPWYGLNCGGTKGALSVSWDDRPSSVRLGTTYEVLTPAVDAEEEQPRAEQHEPSGPRPRTVQVGHCGHGHEADHHENAAHEGEEPRST